MQSRKNRHYTRDAIVASTQPRNKLENRRSQNDKVPTIVWKKYKAKREKREERSKKNGDIRRRKDGEIGSG